MKGALKPSAVILSHQDNVALDVQYDTGLSEQRQIVCRGAGVAICEAHALPWTRGFGDAGYLVTQKTLRVYLREKTNQGRFN